MANAFNNDKGKVDIDAVLSGLQTNYQNNVNSIYNAIVNNGITPTAKTPAACATGINNVRKTTTFRFQYSPMPGTVTRTFMMVRPYNCACTVKGYLWGGGTGYINSFNVNGVSVALGQSYTVAKGSDDITFSITIAGTSAATQSYFVFEFNWLNNS